MTRLTLSTYPNMLGFEQLERLLERASKNGNEGYPPFNIEQTSETSFRITLALAGFAEEDLSITVEDKQLVVKGRQKEVDGRRIFLHRGIAARQFQRSFVLAEGVDVGQAVMENGLLHIDLTQSIPETVVQKNKNKESIIMSKDNLNTSVNDRTVYVSAVNVADLPEAVAKGISQSRVYSLNSSNGERLALVKDRSLAFVVARQNEFHPVPVH